MNVRQIKTLSWLGALALGGWLGWTIYAFVENRPELEARVPEGTQLAVLNGVEAPPPPKEDSVAYEVVKQTFQDMNWPGKPPAEKPVEDELEEPTGPRYKPVAELLRVQFLQVDPGGELSKAQVRYVDPELVAADSRANDQILRIGDKLADPWGGVSVRDITADGVVFAFAPVDDGAPREDEVVPVSAYEGTGAAIVTVGADGVIQPPESPGGIDRIDPVSWNPRKTQMVGEDTWQIGTDTAQEIDSDYSEILTRDLDYRTYRDPSTKKISGVEITKVRDGSLPSQHGLQEGEVLKSINGHTVTSVSDAVIFVKKNADTTDRWIAVFERRGLEYTRTYYSPDR